MKKNKTLYSSKSVTDKMMAKAFERQTKFDVVYADPPWMDNQTGQRGAISHYDLMRLEDIMAMPVREMVSICLKSCCALARQEKAPRAESTMSFPRSAP